MLDGPIDLPTNCRAATVTHVRFLTRNICHTKRISDSREKRETRNVSRETRPVSRETRREVVTYFWTVLYQPLLEGLSTGQVSTDVSTNISTDIYQYTRWGIGEVSLKYQWTLIISPDRSISRYIGWYWTDISTNTQQSIDQYSYRPMYRPLYRPLYRLIYMYPSIAAPIRYMMPSPCDQSPRVNSSGD